MPDKIRINELDNVAVALEKITAEDVIEKGHKIALKDIHKGEAIIKYGCPIGTATQEIPAGTHVHTHNLHTLLKGEQAYEWHPAQPEVHRTEPAVFRGYPREKGRPGYPPWLPRWESRI